MAPTVITELWPGQEQCETYQVLDVKGATSTLPEDAEPGRPPYPADHPYLAAHHQGK